MGYEFTTGDLARRWDVSRERALQLAKEIGLDCRITRLGRLYDVGAVEAATAERRRRASEPGSKVRMPREQS